MTDLFNKFTILIDNVDKKLGEYLFHHHFSVLEEFIYVFAFIFNPLPITCYLILILAIFGKVLFIKTLIITLTGLLLTSYLKKAIGRPRPNCLGNRKYNFRKVEKNLSMPSGDSFQSGLWATIIAIYFNNYYVYYVVPLVMFARCFYQCHFLSDTVVGALLGIFWSNFINYIFLLFNF
jgi:membrane-associated phospholipid phosphatase